MVQLRQNLFETPHAHALIAFVGTPDLPGEPIGFALYFFNFSTWTGRPGLYVCVPSFLIIDSSPPDVNVSTSLKLEDLYVKPEHRKKGAGKAFFRELGKIAREKVIPPSATFFFAFFLPSFPSRRIVDVWTGRSSR